jgi:hypothetical protein
MIRLVAGRYAGSVRVHPASALMARDTTVFHHIRLALRRVSGR